MMVFPKAETRCCAGNA